jgi:hypothetical protein
MGNVGHKIAANIFQPAQSGNIVQHDKHPDFLLLSITQYSAMGLQVACFSILQHDFALYRIGSFQGAPDETLQVGLAGHLGNTLSLHLYLQGVDTKELCRCLIKMKYPLLHIEGKNSFDHTRQYRLLLVALLHNSSNTIIELLSHQVHGLGQSADLHRTGNGQFMIEAALSKALRAVTHGLQRVADTTGDPETD